MSASRKNGKVSIYTVANAAGVSYGTVSRVLNNRQDVNPQTRQRVLEVAKQLGYVPSPIARSLSKRTTAAFGIIVPGIADPFFMPIAESIERAAREMGHATLLHNTGRAAKTILDGAIMLANFRVSGVLILGGSQELDEEIAEQLGGIPAVTVLRPGLKNLFPAVYFDNAAGARQLVAHLVALGYRRIAFVSGDDNSVAGNERLRGYCEALVAAGLTFEPDLIVSGKFTIEGGAAATQQLLALPTAQHPDAIIYASDVMALAGMSQLHQAGRRIPDDIAVAGYGDIPFANISEPPLTTIHVPLGQMGTAAVHLLQQMMQQPAEPLNDVLMNVELVARTSTMGNQTPVQ